jgi:3-oxoadipate enol-lactonase
MSDLAPDRSGWVESRGLEIWWEYLGDGSREVICLLNGLAMSTKSWYGFLPRLLDEYDVILYDYPGQGDSTRDDLPCSIPEIARYLELILDENQVDRIHLMGISYGGFIALDFARQLSERLHTLTLSGIFLSHEKLFQMYQDISLRFYRGSREAFELYTHYMYEKIFSERFVSKLSEEQLDAMRQRFFDRYADETYCLTRLTEAQIPFFESLDANLPAYRAIQTPTLILAGDQDRAIPHWTQCKLCEVLPNARFELLQECGHVVYLEQPDVFFFKLKAFMAAKSIDF